MNTTELKTVMPIYYGKIDKDLVPILYVLNEKGYKTMASCQGHTDKLNEGEKQRVNTYIAFEENYDFDVPFPIIEKRGNRPYSTMWRKKKYSTYLYKCALYCYTSKNAPNHIKEAERKEWINKIYNWALSLGYARIMV